jgi:hypothetical protein
MGGQDVLHVGLDVEKNPITRSLCSILVILMFHSLFETKHMLYWQMQGSSIGKPLLQIRRNKWYQNHVAHNMARKMPMENNTIVWRMMSSLMWHLLNE